MNTKFVDLIHPTYTYHIEKLSDGVHSNHPFAKASCEFLKTMINSIREKAIEKYHNLEENVPGVEYNLHKIDYILLKIDTWIYRGELSNSLDAEVFIHSLKHRLEELKDMMKELDED